MKLFGNRRGGRHVQKGFGQVRATAANSDEVNNNGKHGKKSRSSKRLISIIIISVVVLAAAGYVVAQELRGETELFIRPPDFNPVPRPSANPSQSNPTDSSQPSDSINIPGTAPALGNVRDENKRTFLIFGLDEGANTDVIMLGTFDFTEGNHSLDVVSIPRDTLANVGWSHKMANTIFHNMRVKHRDETDRETRDKLAMQSSVEMFADIFGFEADFWVTLNMRAFRTLVDAVGGVDFYVPSRMFYVDPYQNLRIDFQRGMHRNLTGQQALEILRFRSFANADLGRIQVQQQFLTTAVEQILARRNTLGTPAGIARLADIFFNDVRSNISLGELLWFGREFFELEPENINFYTIPHWMNDFIEGRGYVVIDAEAWLELLNERFNPFSVDKALEDLSILTRLSDSNRLVSTDGNWAGDPNWGSRSRGPGQREAGGENLNVIREGGNQGGGGQATAPPDTETSDENGIIEGEPPPVPNGGAADVPPEDPLGEAPDESSDEPGRPGADTPDEPQPPENSEALENPEIPGNPDGPGGLIAPEAPQPGMQATETPQNAQPPPQTSDNPASTATQGANT